MTLRHTKAGFAQRIMSSSYFDDRIWLCQYDGIQAQARTFKPRDSPAAVAVVAVAQHLQNQQRERMRERERERERERAQHCTLNCIPLTWSHPRTLATGWLSRRLTASTAADYTPLPRSFSPKYIQYSYVYEIPKPSDTVYLYIYIMW